ncbi:MAG TPA: MSMEG_0565 family glycosyltransferase, partial [Burkholderiaceae bacterium]|nr:MSMEG_0565 family glycosyltransferase [Burkholderiaceae bacterium]
ASGVPVVASRIAPFTDHLTDADVSWADPLSAPSIADALVRALNTGDAQRTAASATRLARRFSWPASAARHVQLYRAGVAQAAPALAQAA